MPAPVGLIMGWVGDTANLPDEWAPCDGSKGTPDLRDRPVPGAGITYDPDDSVCFIQKIREG